MHRRSNDLTTKTFGAQNQRVFETHRKESNMDEEQNRRELMEAAELGRKYETANEVLTEIMETQRANILRSLESGDIGQDNDALGLVLYLRVLKICENLIRSKIDAGILAREELRDDGSDEEDF